MHYKAIEILAVRWLGTRVMRIFKATKAGPSPANDDEVSIILLDGWEGLRTMLEY